MKKNLIATTCVMFMVLCVLASASADIIITSATQVQWTWQSYSPGDNPYYPTITNQQYNNPTAEVVSLVTSNPVAELYRGNNNGTEAGLLPGSYATAFGTGNETATITYTGGDIVSPSSPAYLLVRDGNAANPIWYIFDLHNLTGQTAWNGTETIQISEFWPNQYSISHVALYGTQGTGKVPEPATLILYGLGFAGAGLYTRIRRRK